MGIIFYELLTGNLPFKGDNALEIALKHMRDPLPSLRESNPAIPQSIENIILKATAKNPKNRYSDAKAMHDDLLTALDDDRMNEAPYKYKYPETDFDGTKKIKKIDDVEEIVEENLDDLEKEAEEAKEEKKEGRKSNILIIILGVIFVLLVIALAVIFFILPDTNPKPVTVPSCEGLKVSACEKKLQEKGFEVDTEIKSEASSVIDKNRVTRTNPEAGRSIKEGTKITIYKSLGEEVYTIEDYTGKNYIEVQTILETKYGLDVSIEKRDVDASDREYDEQEIIGQSLAAGSKVKEGDSSILYIPNIVDTIPDMAGEGWSLADAEAFCDKYGLTIKVEYQDTTAYEEGKIIDQSRAAGSPIVKGQTFTVTIARKPAVQTKPTTPTNPDDNDDDSTDTPSTTE